jgi:hypothetical protein
MTLDELKRLYARSTQDRAPWWGDGEVVVDAENETVVDCYNDEDAEFIAAMHAMLPKLIAVAEAARPFVDDVTADVCAESMALLEAFDALEAEK